MDTDHPYFQQPAPEYDDPPEDVFRERLVDRGVTLNIRFNLPQIQLAGEVFRDYVSDTRSVSTSELETINAILIRLDQCSTPQNERTVRRVIMYAFGTLGMGGESMEQLAGELGISRQAFSKKVQLIQNEFGIQPRNGMRPKHQRKLYQDVQRKHEETIHRFKP